MTIGTGGTLALALGGAEGGLARILVVVGHGGLELLTLEFALADDAGHEGLQTLVTVELLIQTLKLVLKIVIVKCKQN